MSAAPYITMHPVTSSQISAIGHSPELNVLAIQFPPKKSTGVSDVYHYQGVGAELFAEFLAAESQGSFFIQRIKKFPDLFPYAKMDPAALPAAPAPAVKLSKELLAVALNGREYPFELTKDEQAQAKAAGLVVIFGASDDLMEVRGAAHGEISAPTTVLLDCKGLLPHREDIQDDEVLKDFFDREPLARAVDGLWCAEEDASWTYRTKVPHATFDIVEDGIVYCRGIVIDVADLGGAV